MLRNPPAAAPRDWRQVALRLLALALAVAAGIGVMRILDAASRDFLLGGIQVNEPDQATWTQALVDHGLDTVEVTVYAKQGDWDSANLWFDEDEEPWEIQEIRAARARGLNVVLILRVALDHAFERNRFFWHGMIYPLTDEDLSEWFGRYRRFVLRWAEIAEEEGVDLLAIASEMNALTDTVPVVELPALEEYFVNEEKVEEERAKILDHADVIEERHLWVRGSDGYDDLEIFLSERDRAQATWARRVSWLGAADPVARINERRARMDDYWRDLVRSVREVYDGPLTYAANFDQYRAVAFWDALDLIGINAYFPLRHGSQPDIGTAELAVLLRQGWRDVLADIEELRVSRGLSDQRIFFTELGYVRRRNCTIEPWAATGFSVVPTAGNGTELLVWEDQPDDPVERALAVRSLYDAHLEMGGEMLAGILYWKLSTVAAHADVEPFVLVLGDDPEDPLLRELRRFEGRLVLARWGRRVRGWLGMEAP